MGSGFKTFTAGSVLTASDVQNYLQDQAVMVFGGTAARSSAIGTANFEEGMLTYLTDVDKLQVYTGSSFQDVYPPAATSQGMTLINTTSFSAVASQSVNNVFSSTYDNYLIVLECNAASGNYVNFRLRVAGVDASGSNYDWGMVNVTNGAAAFQLAGSGATASNILRPSATGRSMTSFTICNPAIARPTVFSGTLSYNDGATIAIAGGMGGTHSLSTAYDGFTLIHATSITGSVSVYGQNK